MSLGEIFKKGSIWTLAMTVCAMAISYLRNILLTYSDPDGYTLGAVSMAFIYLQLVLTLGSLSCGLVITKFLPIISDFKQRFKFVSLSLLIQIPLSIGAIALLFYAPENIIRRLGGAVIVEYRWWAIALTASALASGWLASILPGILKFSANAKVSIIVPAMLFIMAIFSVAEPKFVYDNVFEIVFVILITGNLATLAYTLKNLRGNFRYCAGFYAPYGFYSAYFWFSCFGILSFLTANLSQLFVVSYMGLELLGVYFAFHQLALLSNLAVRTLGTPMLATFSSIIADNSADSMRRLSSAYSKLCRKMNAMTFVCVSFFICFNAMIGSIFGEIFEKYSYLLIIMCLGVSLANTNNVLQHIIFARGWISANVFRYAASFILYFIFLYFTIEEYGVVSASLGFAIYYAIQQLLMLAFVYAKTRDNNYLPKSDYWCAQLLSLILAAIFLFANVDKIFVPTIACLLSIIIYFKLTGFSIKEAVSVLPKRISEKLASIIGIR